jgi:hypothetical protein
VYDFWFSLGVAAMRPALLRAVYEAGPEFTFVTRVTTETPEGRAPRITSPASTGWLKADPTTRVRLAIAQFVREFPGRPPIGIACAGRFCQLMCVRNFDGSDPPTVFPEIIDMVNAGYRDALGGGPESPLPAFPAFLGACLMDAKLALEIRNGGSPGAVLAEILGEFGIPADPGDASLQLAIRFANSRGVEAAYDKLMNSENDPWRGVCYEQILFWTDKSEYAIP